MHLIVWGIIVSVAAGAAVAYAAPRFAGDLYRVTRVEFMLGFALCALVISPATAWVGSKVALSNNLRFEEYWNGWEVSADRREITCHRDGQCKWEYDCDSYQVTVTRTRSVPDGNGGTKTETYTDTETRWHSCPYVTHEYHYTVDTTLGEYTVAAHRFPDSPDQHRWRGRKGVPSHVAARAGTGAPTEWVEARKRIDAGDPGPVTAVKPYDNYILASQHSTLRKLSMDIERYEAADLIPAPANGVETTYRADKVHLIGVTGDEQRWRDSVDRLAAALGSERQGDLQLVAVDADQIDDPDTYVAALMASWAAPTRGKQGLAKNSVVLVTGVRNGEVDWARLDTGMPVGNEALQIAVRDGLPGTKFSPEALTGHARSTSGGVDIGGGAFAQLLFDDTAGFKRACMVCDDPEDEGLGFSYLSSEIRPTGGQSAAIVTVAGLLSLVVWGMFAAFAVGPHHTGTGRPSDDGRPDAPRTRHLRFR